MTTEAKLFKAKLNLLELGSYLGNVFEACRTLGYSRDTFYRLEKRFDEGGIEALREIQSSFSKKVTDGARFEPRNDPDCSQSLRF
jgi:hypothetical protein